MTWLFEGVKTEVNGAIETLKADNAVAVDGLKTELEELKSQISVVKDAADKLEAKNNRKTMNENQAKGFNLSLAEAIEKNADSIAKLGRGEQKRSGFILDTKAVGNMTEAVNLTGGLERQYAPQVYALPSRKVHIRSLLPVGNLSTGLFTFPKETGGEGDAAPQTQGSAKSQIDFDITMTDAPAQYIAGFVRISRQMLDDVPAMTSFLQARLLEKYLLAEDAQLLNGNGTAPNLQGITGVASAATGAATVDVEQLVQAIAQVYTADYSANGILIIKKFFLIRKHITYNTNKLVIHNHPTSTFILKEDIFRIHIYRIYLFVCHYNLFLYVFKNVTGMTECPSFSSVALFPILGPYNL